MLFSIDSVATVDENVGFRMIGHLVAQTDDEKALLPDLADSMQEVLDTYAETVQPEIGTYTDGDVKRKTIYYRAVSLPELAYILGVYNNGFPFKTTVELSSEVKMYPDDIGGIFQFQLQCFKQQHNL